MKTQYNGKLRCATCRSDSHFEFNEDKSYIKCTNCNREYLGGYDELLKLNQDTIDEIKSEIAMDVKNEITKQFKDAFKGNKHIKLK